MVNFNVKKDKLISYRGNRKKVVIPDNVFEIGAKVFMRSKNITKLSLPANTAVIGREAFSDCENLRKVKMPGVTRIGEWAFYNCGSIEEICLPESVVFIGDYAFSRCKNLRTFSVPHRVTTVSNSLFYDCSSLERIEIPQGVKTISNWAFGRCGRLKAVTIPDSVRTIGEKAFFECYSLEEMTVPDSVTFIGEKAFYRCDKLKRLTIFGYTVDSTGWNWKEDSPEEVRKMLLTGDYSGNVSLSTKLLFVMRDYLEKRAPAAEAFLINESADIFAHFIAKNNYERIRLLLETDIRWSIECIELALDYATENTRKGGDMQIQALLADYKNQHHPDADPFGELKV
jgi:hypothetical protein